MAESANENMNSASDSSSSNTTASLLAGAKTEMKLMTRNMAARLADTVDDNTKVTVFEYAEDSDGGTDDSDVDEEEDDRNLRKNLSKSYTVAELRPILERLKTVANAIRDEHPEWDDDRNCAELMCREPALTESIGTTHAMMLKFIAAQHYTTAHDNILGYLLYIREMVEQKQLTPAEANYMVAQNVEKEVQRMRTQQRSLNKQKAKQEKKKRGK